MSMNPGRQGITVHAQRGVAAALACACSVAVAQPRPPAEPRTVAPSYTVPVPITILGPERGSQLYLCPVPFSGNGYCPVPLLPYGTSGASAPQPAAASASAGAEQPPVGHIVLVVNPVGAQVTLDGVRLTQRTDLSYAVGVLEGRHLIRVSAQGFEAHERALDVQRGIGLFVTVRLAPVEAEKKAP